MNFKFIVLFLLLFATFSCKNDNENRVAENIKDTQRKELIFSKINKSWVFNANPINSTSQVNKTTWKEWGEFLAVLEQKPKKTIGAFQKKSAEMSKKVFVLNSNLPIEFNIPQIKSRIAVLITKVRMFDLYIHLDNIPDKEVTRLISEINIELVSLQLEMDKIVQKKKIPLEEGESELLKMLDSARAIPNVMPPLDQNTPRVE